jgi:hypothetical protein
MTRIGLSITLALLCAPALAAERAPEIGEMLRKAAAHRAGAGDFRWREIPWFDEPAAALRQAREEKRPLFVWLSGGRDRDGSPLERC